MCPTCDQPAGSNFGGLCDQCEAGRRARTARARSVLAAFAAAGHAATPFGRAIGAHR